jgi:uncharacterized protein (TIGR03000 family)
MSKFARVAALAGLGVLCATPPIQAQHRGGHGGSIGGRGIGGRGFAGRGFGRGGFGGFFGPWGGYGGYPGSYLYPGGFGYGYPGYFSPSYISSTEIYQPITVFVMANMTQMVGTPEDNQVVVPDKPASIEVVLPAKATLLVNGRQTQQTGAKRQFVTPPLPASGVYTCELRATWTDTSGAEVIRTQIVRVAAEQRVVVSFADSGEPGGAEASAARDTSDH